MTTRTRTRVRLIDGLPIVKKESDAYAVYDATAGEIVAYAPGVYWSLSKSKHLREQGTGHTVYYVGCPNLPRAVEDDIEHARRLV